MVVAFLVEGPLLQIGQKVRVIGLVLVANVVAVAVVGQLKILTDCIFLIGLTFYLVFYEFWVDGAFADCGILAVEASRIENVVIQRLVICCNRGLDRR